MVRDAIIKLNDGEKIDYSAISERTGIDVNRLQNLKYDRLKKGGTKDEYERLMDAYGHFLAIPIDEDTTEEKVLKEIQQLRKDFEEMKREMLKTARENLEDDQENKV